MQYSEVSAMQYVELNIEAWRNEILNLRNNITFIKWPARRDLKIMIDALEKKLSHICKEDIICRRKGKQTDKQAKLCAELIEQKNDVAQYITFAKLIG